MAAEALSLCSVDACPPRGVQGPWTWRPFAKTRTVVSPRAAHPCALWSMWAPSQCGRPPAAPLGRRTRAPLTVPCAVAAPQPPPASTATVQETPAWVTRHAENPALRGNFAPVQHEVTLDSLVVDGNLPPCVDGVYLRNVRPDLRRHRAQLPCAVLAQQPRCVLCAPLTSHRRHTTCLLLTLPGTQPAFRADSLPLVRRHRHGPLPAPARAPEQR